MSVVIVDTEYTTWPGALESGWSQQGQHREIVQISAILVGDDFAENASFDVIVKPAINPILSPLFVDLTGISQVDVESLGVRFEDALRQFFSFTRADTIPVVCMNGDESVFRENCVLSRLEFPFAKPWHRLRPFLEESGVDVRLHSSGSLHELTPSSIVGRAHNALHDVRSMAVWLAHAKEVGIFQGLDELPTGAPLSDPRSSSPFLSAAGPAL